MSLKYNSWVQMKRGFRITESNMILQNAYSFRPWKVHDGYYQRILLKKKEENKYNFPESIHIKLNTCGFIANLYSVEFYCPKKWVNKYEQKCDYKNILICKGTAKLEPAISRSDDTKARYFSRYVLQFYWPLVCYYPYCSSNRLLTFC